MSIAVKDVEFFVRNMRTRMPFKYGIATLTALPHLMLRAVVEVDGKTQHGFAADGLPPKWFTKDPATTFEEDLVDMLAVIRQACEIGKQAPPAASAQAWWRGVYEAQGEWARGVGYPPLLWNFGVSLIERAVIDAVCRAKEIVFRDALSSGALGVTFEAKKLSRVAVRHTVGLADPLTETDEEDDGLPRTLVDCIRAYGLTHFKIKISGRPEQDLVRLGEVMEVLRDNCREFKFTLDGNENYRALEPFRQLWERLRELPGFSENVLFVEQPLHRDVALSEGSARAMLGWQDRPPMIIDESDATFESLPRALEAGYAGTSHKNCKGIFKGVRNAALIAERAAEDRSRPYILSAEDLANVGPVALLEDLAVVAALGITHAERNGHHYFKGLSAFPQEMQAQILREHKDLYHRQEKGFATLAIEDGLVSTESVSGRALGVGFEPALDELTPLDMWDSASLGA